MQPCRGNFITLEGGEGAGKSTQAALLCQHLRHIGMRVLLTREPGGSDFAERVRTLILDPATPAHSPLSEALLFSAARADHLETVIRPALHEGIWVICDRFADSTRAYQGAAGGLEDKTVLALEKIVVGNTTPDLTLILDLPVKLACARVALRVQSQDRDVKAGLDPYESRHLQFHERLRQGFLDIAAAASDRCIVIDGTDGVDTIARNIWDIVATRLMPENN
ncbi:MAG: dTMP kinase [Pseudomonadota bacterium]